MTIKTLDVAENISDRDTNGERPFGPCRYPITPSGQDFVDEVAALLLTHEEETGLRRRKRRSNDQVTFERTVSALASDLAINILAEEAKGLHLSRSNRHLGRVSRYRSEAASKSLPMLLDLMADPTIDLIKQEIGFRSVDGQSRRTVIFPAPRLETLVMKYQLTPADFGDRPLPELI